MATAPKEARPDPIAQIPKVLVAVALVLAVLAAFTGSALVRVLAAASAMILLAGAGATHMFAVARLADAMGHGSVLDGDGAQQATQDGDPRPDEPDQG